MPWMSWKPGPSWRSPAAPCSASSPARPTARARRSSRAWRRGEDRYDTLLRLGASARAAGDPAAAVRCIRRAIAQNRSRVDAYVLLGDALVDMNAYDDAAKTYQEALARDANNIAAHRGLCSGHARPEPAGDRRAPLSGGADASARTICRRTTAWASPTTSPASTRRPRQAYRAGLAIAPGQHAPAQQPRAVAGAVRPACGSHRAPAQGWSTSRGRRRATGRTWRSPMPWPGDLVAAERISRLDLDEEAVQNNLGYFAALAAIEDDRKRASGLGVQAPS